MYSLRSRNSARGVSPVLHEILPRIDAAQSETQITNEFKAVCKYFKDDMDDIAMFWLDGNPYDSSSENHMDLLRWVFATVDLNHPYSVHFLNNIKSVPLLKKLGVQRVCTSETTYYRLLLGEIA